MKSYTKTIYEPEVGDVVRSTEHKHFACKITKIDKTSITTDSKDSGGYMEHIFHMSDLEYNPEAGEWIYFG